MRTLGGDYEPVLATHDQIEKFITKWVAEIPKEQKEAVRKILRELLVVPNDDTAAFDEDGAAAKASHSKYPHRNSMTCM